MGWRGTRPSGAAIPTTRRSACWMHPKQRTYEADFGACRRREGSRACGGDGPWGLCIGGAGCGGPQPA